MHQPLPACRRTSPMHRTADAACLRDAAGVCAQFPLSFAYAPLQ